MPAKTSENSVKVLAKLQPHQDELQKLGELAGIQMDSKVFRILVEFLNMGVDPNTVFNTLKTIRRSTMSRNSYSAVSSKVHE